MKTNPDLAKERLYLKVYCCKGTGVTAIEPSASTKETCKYFQGQAENAFLLHTRENKFRQIPRWGNWQCNQTVGLEMSLPVLSHFLGGVLRRVILHSDTGLNWRMPKFKGLKEGEKSN